MSTYSKQPNPPSRQLFNHFRRLEAESLGVPHWEKFIMFITFAFIIILILSKTIEMEATQKFNEFHLNRHDPSIVLSMLGEGCRKHELQCSNNVDQVVTMLDNIVVLLAGHENKPEFELMAMIESLNNDLRACKDAECIMNFEKESGRLFHLALLKSNRIIREIPEVESYIDEEKLFVLSFPQ